MQLVLIEFATLPHIEQFFTKDLKQMLCPKT